MKSLVLMLAMAALLGGCATGQVMWIKSDYTPEQFEKDKRQCVYEVQLATATYGSGQATARTNSGAIAQGFGNGMAIAMTERRLAIACMEAKGYTMHVQR